MRTGINARAVSPGEVHETIAGHMLADGFDVVLDLENSRGARLHDSRSGKSFLDLFTCFASSPIGYNHPRMREPEFVDKLGRVAVNKPSNSDLYTVEMAEFVDAFGRLATPKELPHLFFVSGGTLACDANCNYDTLACTFCGDGSRNGNEVCEGADFGGETCISQGFTGGALLCDGSCAYDTSACTF